MAGLTWDDLYRDMVLPGLRDFRNCDSNMLLNQLNERSITHRIAECYQARFDKANGQAVDQPRGFSIDCEYNRVGINGQPKKIPLDHDIPWGPGVSYYTPNPDIILHHRGDDSANLLANEVKLFYNDDPFAVLLDKVKLAAYVYEPLFYRSGLYLDLGLTNDDVVVKEAKLISVIQTPLSQNQDRLWNTAMSIQTVLDGGRCKMHKVNDERRASAGQLMKEFEDAFGFKDVTNQFCL